MQTIRRLYLYAVALVSMETVLWGVIGLARSILAGQEIGGQASRLASALSLILVGVPVFLLHWALAQRSAVRDPEERSARLRAVFLYAALGATLVPVVQNILALLSRTLVAAFGLDTFQALIGGSQTLADNLVAAVFNVVIAIYFYRILQADWGSGLSGEAYAEVRRLYRYLWMLYSLALLVAGAQQVLRYLFTVWIAVGKEVNTSAANGIALLLVGAPLWVFTGQHIQRSLDQRSEAFAALRLVVLYVLSLTGAISVLGSVGVLVYDILRVLLGESVSLPRFMAQAGVPLSIAIPLGVLWAYYGRALEEHIRSVSAALEEADPTRSRAAGLRRLYNYLLSLLGLVAGVIGLNQLLSYLLDTLIGQPSFIGAASRNTLAAALAALLVGLPLWYLTWRPMLLEAAREGESGDHARRSLVRKSYLYLALFTSVIGLMFSTGALLFELISALLGAPPERLLLDALQLFKLMVLFGLLLVYHGFALRGDARLAQRSLARRHAQFPVLVLAPDEGDFGGAIAAALERELSGLPVAIHPYSQGAPDESLSAARAVILPAGLSAHPGEALRLWLQGYQGVRMVIPTGVEGWHWVTGSGRSLASLAKQTARAVRSLAEGEEIPPPLDSSPWMVAVYILAALFAIQVVLGLTMMVVSLVAG